MTAPISVTIEDAGGRLVARYPVHTYRFLLSDGQVVDVEAAHNDSDLSRAVVDRFAGPGVTIVGVATLGAGS